MQLASTAVVDLRSLSVRSPIEISSLRFLSYFCVGPDGIPDANPEAVIVGSPVDGTKNFPTALGNAYEDITGVVTYQCASQFRVPRYSTNITYADLVSTMSYPSQLRK